VDQIYYLELLSKYSPNANRFKVVKSGDMPLRKEAFVKDNFSYLTIDQQVGFNDCAIKLGSDKYNSYMLGIGTFFAAFAYYAIKTPLTRSLMKESWKSFGIAVGTGYIYYRYHHSQYLDSIHKYYVLIIQEKNRKRESRNLDHSEN